MEDIKLILVDIDGTLLNDDGIITPKTKEAIARIKEKNIMFGIATGRTPYAVKHLIKDWQIDKYVDLIMGFNGGCYLDLKNNRTKSHYLLDGKLIPEILNEFNRFNFNVGIYDKESLHVLEDEKIAKAIAKRNKLPLIIDDLRQYYNRQIEKILFMADTEELDKIDAVSEDAMLDAMRADLSKNDIVLAYGDKLERTEKYSDMSDEDIDKINKVRDIKINRLLEFLYSDKKRTGKIYVYALTESGNPKSMEDYESGNRNLIEFEI